MSELVKPVLKWRVWYSYGYGCGDPSWRLGSTISDVATITFTMSRTGKATFHARVQNQPEVKSFPTLPDAKAWCEKCQGEGR